MANDQQMSPEERRRLELSAEFHKIVKNVYFEPPEGKKMEYPCIVYERASGITEFANNLPYMFNYRYTVTVIDKDPDSDLPGMIAKLKMCTFDRGFISDNLYHKVFTIF